MVQMPTSGRSATASTRSRTSQPITSSPASVSIRPATDADLPALRELYAEFYAEVPPPDYVDEPLDKELGELPPYVREHIAFVAEADGEAVGFALARLKSAKHGHLSDLYVRPNARRHGVGRALTHEVVTRLAERGADVVELEVLTSNADARHVYERWGFAPVMSTLAAPVAQLSLRLARKERPPSVGSLHVQTDDENAVERAMVALMPRLGSSAWSEVSPARRDWVTVIDELCDRDRSVQRRAGTELSERLGVPVVAFALEEEAVVRFLLFDRGRMVDEYLSVPSYYGELNRADELALAANPTLVARLTGADPARVRAVARVASSPSELPPPRELLAELAAVMSLEARIDR
jgi:ribosomal protein S18 acetylase RimI-like enzyme